MSERGIVEEVAVGFTVSKKNTPEKGLNQHERKPANWTTENTTTGSLKVTTVLREGSAG